MPNEDSSQVLVAQVTHGVSWTVRILLDRSTPAHSRFQMPEQNGEPARDMSADDAVRLAIACPAPVYRPAIVAALRQAVQHCSQTDPEGAGGFFASRLLACHPGTEEKAAEWVWLGSLLERRKSFRQAAVYYQMAIQSEPADPRSWHLANSGLGACLNRIGRHAEAETFCRAAVKAAPGQYLDHKNLGIALEGQGRLLDAVESYARASELESGDLRALSRLHALLKRHPRILQGSPRVARAVNSLFCRFGMRVIGMN